MAYIPGDDEDLRSFHRMQQRMRPPSPGDTDYLGPIRLHRGNRDNYPKTVDDKDEELRDQHRQAVSDFKNTENAIRRDEAQVQQLLGNIESRKRRLNDIGGHIEHIADKIRLLKEEKKLLTDRVSQIDLEVEMLEEDPGNENAIQLLKKEKSEIINRL